MQIYAKEKDPKSTYIVDLLDDDSDHLTVVFGDGRRHEDIINTKDNIAKIEKKMEEQIEFGLKRKTLYTVRSIVAASLTAASLTGAGATVLNNFESIQGSELKYYAAGAVLLTCAGSSLIWWLREQARLDELSKVKYREDHAESLKKIPDYTHALDTTKSSVAALINSSDNPFGILNVEKYSKKDLEKIIKEIEREDTMRNNVGVQYATYVKRK